MTIKEALIKYKKIRNDSPFTDEQLIHCLSEVDCDIYTNVILTHEGGEGVEFKPYREFEADFDYDTELLIPDEYSSLYFDYLQAQTAYYLNETERYNNSYNRYMHAYDKYEKYYHSQHRPLQLYKWNY